MAAWNDGFWWLLLGTKEGSVAFNGCCWELKRDWWLSVAAWIGGFRWLLLGTFGGFHF